MLERSKDPEVRAEYRGYPTPEIIDRARKVALGIITASVSTPSVVPGDGQRVDFIWSKNGWDLELSVGAHDLTVWARKRGGVTQLSSSSAYGLARFMAILARVAIPAPPESH